MGTTTSTPRFIALHFIALLQYCVFYKLKVHAAQHWANLSAPFFQQLRSLRASVSHFGNTHNISNFFIIIFVMMICDL